MLKNYKKVFVLVGLPRSGKSTLVKLVNEKNPSIVLVSADKLRKKIYGQQFYDNGEPIVWAVRKYMLMSLLENNQCIIIDETNTTIDRRMNIIELAKKYGYEIHAIFIDTLKDICIDRAKKTGYDNIIPIIEGQSSRLQPPIKQEGFNSIQVVKDNNYQALNWLIFNSLDYTNRMRGE
jgi:predicted kinase